ncbi:MAG: hypothetical protein QGH90_04850 [Candidatus Poseidoniaceae archaeon]|nr:hypothetical protein [Candidatus Poseidoniaceae archaeon]MDP7001212.1 hypothetical protein [Candidatus Poseidoniaceae archaeon]
MGIFNRDQPWTGLAVVMSVFALDFLLHILFAAWGWTIMFKIIAVEIAIIVHAVGPLALLIGGQRSSTDQKIAFQIGSILSIPLSIGYWWAVNGMSWDNWLVLTPMFALAIHLLFWPRQMWLASLFFTNKV